MENGLHIVRDAKVFVYFQTKLAHLICLIGDHVDIAGKIIESKPMVSTKIIKTNGVVLVTCVDASKHIQDTTMLDKARLLIGVAKNALLKRRDFLQTLLSGKSKGYTTDLENQLIQEELNGILHLRSSYPLTMGFVL